VPNLTSCDQLTVAANPTNLIGVSTRPVHWPDVKHFFSPQNLLSGVHDHAIASRDAQNTGAARDKIAPCKILILFALGCGCVVLIYLFVGIPWVPSTARLSQALSKHPCHGVFECATLLLEIGDDNQ
jgi:hypothetical protein